MFIWTKFGGKAFAMGSEQWGQAGHSDIWAGGPNVRMSGLNISLEFCNKKNITIEKNHQRISLSRWNFATKKT
jgi:hypothetical protein